MERDKILEAARKQKGRGREFEEAQYSKSTSFSAVGALIVGMALCLVEFFAKGTVNFGLVAVGVTASGIDLLYQGIKLKRVVFIILGAVELLGMVLAILIFVGQVVLL